jgi:hypothetical protein
MSKKLICLVSFVLVLSLTDNSSADLVVHWRFDEGSGTTAFDTSGNGRDGTFTGEPQWVSGHNSAGALHFDGVDDFVSHVLPGDQTYAAFTIAVWVKADDVDQAQLAAIFASRFPGGATGAGFQIDIDTQVTPQVYQIRPNSDGGVFGNTTTDWVYLAVVCEGTSAQLYYQGVPANEATLVSSLFNEFTVGVNRARSRFFAGTIDDLRVYDHALSEAEILAATQGAEVYPYALGPEPSDGTLVEATWVNLSWLPGELAVSHDVYLGDNFDDVDSGAEGTFQGNQTTTLVTIGLPGFAFPEGLVPGTTYYWRIDEVNDTEPNSPWKGPIWSFSIPPKTAYFPVPADGAESVAVDAQLSWTEGFGSKLHTVYFGDNFDDVSNAAGGLPQGSATYNPGPLKMAKTYYWRVDEFDAVDTFKGDVWSFITEGAVGSPEPANSAVDVTQSPILTWVHGVFADTHEVYFGADATSLKLKGSGNLGSESYEPGQLEWNTTYYWRIDEANSTNPDSPWTGPLWSFTTANFLIVDDFESYNDLNEDEPGSNRIYLAWVDGFDNPAINGSIVGHANPPFAEQTIVHGGLQSMPMAYDNAVGKSEATLTLTSNRDWTINSVNTLTIWFRGSAGNAAEQMYVALNGNARVDHDDPDAATKIAWTEWNIDLTRFADQGVNLSNVNSITLGLGNRANLTAGGSGLLYFDDIRLYPSEPETP